MQRLATILFVLSILLLTGCRTSSLPVSEQASSETGVDYTLVYMVHGDSEYLYHDEDGQSRQADKRVVDNAVALAEQAAKGEVFIFHLRPEKKLLGLFPQKDRRLLHYRNGSLLQDHKYSPEENQMAFEAESELFDALSEPQSNKTVFLYFGHEIPSGGGEGYHSSRKDVPFNTGLFAKGLKSFQPEKAKIDLTVLSSCDNLTPDMVHHLQPITSNLLGSPQNLHLSHIDTEKLLQLEEDKQISSKELAEEVAEHSFDRLTKAVQTAVTLTVLDLKEVDSDHLINQYNSFIGEGSSYNSTDENIDCNELSFWDDLSAPVPYKVFYRPARFGPNTHKESHSGWGCPSADSGIVHK